MLRLSVSSALLSLAAAVSIWMPGPMWAAEPARDLGVVTLQVPGQSPTGPLYGQSHALVIGASQYVGGWPRLPGVPGDVQAVERLLTRQGFQVRTVMNPTRDQLDSALRSFAATYGLSDNNRLLVYFAGHGHTLTTRQNKRLGYIVPVDAPRPDQDEAGFRRMAYSMENFEQLSRQIEAKHALFVFDSCFSGTVFRSRSGVPDAISSKTDKPVRQFITAGDENQPVPDESIFRRQLERALGPDAEADLNGDGYITGTELGSFLEDTVTQYSKKSQTPRWGKLSDPDLDRGDFVFLNPARLERVPTVRRPGDATGVNLVDLERESSTRREWAQWQTRMQADFDKIATFGGSADLQAKAWERFLVTWAEDNPLSADDEALRGQAQQRLVPAREAARQPVQVVQGSASGKACRECPETVLLQAGSFQMGSPAGEAGRDSDEGPVHTVRIGYRLAVGKTHVTKGEFAAFVNATGYRTEAEQGDGCYGWTGTKWEKRTNFNWRSVGFEQGSDHPVVCVSWNDTQRYIGWLNEKSVVKGWRLLSEAEYEYAARAGASTRYWWGDDSDNSKQCAFANGADQSAKRNVPGASSWTTASCDDGYVYTSPVGGFKGNGWGLQDMAGNAWSWTQDCNSATYDGAPTDGSAVNPSSCSLRVLRGGSWDSSPRRLRSAVRGGDAPDGGSDYTGFRLARTVF